MKKRRHQRSSSIYHSGQFGRTDHEKSAKAIRLNLKAVNDLLGRNPRLSNFDELTADDRQELERRFAIYCQIGAPDFRPGREEKRPEWDEESQEWVGKYKPAIDPSFDNLPNKNALKFARDFDLSETPQIA